MRISVTTIAESNAPHTAHGSRLLGGFAAAGRFRDEDAAIEVEGPPPPTTTAGADAPDDGNVPPRAYDCAWA